MFRATGVPSQLNSANARPVMSAPRAKPVPLAGIVLRPARAKSASLASVNNATVAMARSVKTRLENARLVFIVLRITLVVNISKFYCQFVTFRHVAKQKRLTYVRLFICAVFCFVLMIS